MLLCKPRYAGTVEQSIESYGINVRLRTVRNVSGCVLSSTRIFLVIYKFDVPIVINETLVLKCIVFRK